MKRAIFVLSIVHTVFISLFALDSLSDPIGLLIHLIPTYLLIAAILSARKNIKAGAIVYSVLAVLSFLFFRTYSDLVPFLLITLPLMCFASGYWYLVSRNK